MRTDNMKIETFTVRVAWGFASTVVFLLGGGFAAAGRGLGRIELAQDLQPKTFSSPAEASDALFQAAQKEMGRPWKLSSEQERKSLRRATKRRTSSNASSSAKNTRRCTVWSKSSTEPRCCTSAQKTGPSRYHCFPKNGAWFFDSKTGAQEMLFRRIGENESAAIEVCEEFAITKKDQDAKPASYDPITQFAQSLVSADASSANSNSSSSFHGYYFRIVNGNSAATTSRYVSVGDKKTGLALVAYPAEYRSSGVKTFIVTRHDIVYEKDLGPNTTTVAPSIKARSSSWRPAE